MHTISRNRTTMPRLAAKFYLIRLELAREPSKPAGDQRIGYLIVAPLDADGRIDAAGWRQNRQLCTVIRFRPDAEPAHGHLVRRPGGSWALHYDGDQAPDDEAGYHFQDERFIIGEYISIREQDASHTYRIVAVDHA